MKRCELCGADVPKELEECSRCGFTFQKVIRADVRDRNILDRHAGKPVETVKRDLKNSRAQMAAYLDNILAKSLTYVEVTSLLDEAMAFMQIPLILGVDDELKLDDEEAKFVKMMRGHLERSDLENRAPVGTRGTYMRLGNALQAIGESESAMQMIEKALLLNPRDNDAMFTRAKLLFYAKKYPQARKALEKVMAGGTNANAAYLAELIDQMTMC